MVQLIPDGTYIIFSVASNKVVELQNGQADGKFIVVTKAIAIKQYQKITLKYTDEDLYTLTALGATSASVASSAADVSVVGNDIPTDFLIEGYAYADDEFIISTKLKENVWTVQTDDQIKLGANYAAETQRWVFQAVKEVSG